MSKLSANFSREEFACKDNCGFDTVDVELIPIAETIRSLIGSFSPSSACRCIKHNEKIQKKYIKNYIEFSSKSKHLEGRAIDVTTDRAQELYNFLTELYPNTYGIGIYSWGIHIDTRQEKKRWDNRK